MKITLLQENLEKAVLQVSRVVNNKAQLPILTNILFSAGKDGLFLSATNLEISIVTKVAAKIEEEGKITLPAKTIQELVGSLPKENVVISQDKDTVILSCGRVKLKLNAVGAEDYPSIPRASDKDKALVVKGEEFINACSQVVFSASQDEARPALTGVRLGIDKKGIEMVATDGYRLSKKTFKIDSSEEKTMIIPARTLSELVRMTGEKEDISIYPQKKDNQVIFAFGDTQVVSRLIEGEFPPFAKVIPSHWETEAVVDKGELTQALRLASVFARASANIIKFKILKDSCKISANASGVGEDEAEIEAKTKGESVEIAFNYRFLQDFLAVADKEQVVIKLNGSLSPAILEPEGDNSLLHVIMPVRVQTP